VKIAFFLQFGYPGETREDIEATLQMVRDCQPDDIGMSVSYPLPGTRFYDNVRAQLGDKQNWLDSGDFEMMYSGPYSSDFYRKLHTVLHKEYRARKTWKKLTTQNGHTPLPSKARAGASMVYNLATLPLERWKLEKLARQSRPSPLALPRIMSPDAASKPSAQID